MVALEPYSNPKTGDAGFANVYGTVGYEIGSIGEADPEWGRVEDDRDWLSVSADFSAGVADTLSLGLTYLARQQNNKLIGAMYGVETQDLTNYKSTAYWAGQWTGEAIGNAAGIGAAAGALKAGAKYVGRHGLTNTAKNVGRGVVKKTTHFVDDVVLNKSNKQCGFFKRLVGKGCFVAGTPVHVAALPNGFDGEVEKVELEVTTAEGIGLPKTQIRSKTVAIEHVPLGTRITTKNPDGTGFDFDPGEESDWIRIEMEFEREEGATVRVEMLRKHEDFGHLAPGQLVPLQTSEKELSGNATILKVDRNFGFAQGEGNIVTARYITSHVDLIASITLENGEVIQGTVKHPIWSETKQEFVEMAGIRPGEKLNTLPGHNLAKMIDAANQQKTVFNLEVIGSHVYRIGTSGILVHNNQNYEQLVNAADEARDVAGATRGAAAQLDIPGHPPIIGFSGEQDLLVRRLDDALEGLSDEAKNLLHFGECAEIDCINQALRNNIDVRGGFMQAIHISSDPNIHGTLRPPCDACKELLDFFGIGWR